MIRKGTNAVQIFDDLNATGQKDRMIWWGDLNNVQLKKILTWTFDKGYTVITTPCGGKMIDINLEDIKIKCLETSIYFYEHCKDSTLTIEGYKDLKKQLDILKFYTKIMQTEIRPHEHKLIWKRKEEDQKEY